MDVNIRFAGEAGQGIQTAADLLGKTLNRAGRFSYCSTDAESRIRGGLNFSHARCSTEPRHGITNRIDILVALSKLALETYGPLVSPEGAVICEKNWEHPARIPLDVADLARKAGSIKVETTVSIAFLLTLLGVDLGYLRDLIRQRWGKDPKILEANLAAADLGNQSANEWGRGKRFHLPGEGIPDGRLWIAGHEAVALGAVAGGVSFMTAYPMSPATGILTSLALWSEKTGILVHQAEDEIAAINMVAAASYAGARAMTTTSGGGFSLMTEGVSLMGMIETPAVIVIGQRPGPATGLPTRTAQGDLHLVWHAGHGYFPRIILAPHGIRDCFETTAQAFDLAEKYQVPVFVLTDQLLLDSWTNVEPFPVNHLSARRYFLSADELESMQEYKRYAITDSGISPMAAPGISRHTVVADSDEHDEDGHMVESAHKADAMAHKRLRKEKTLREAIWLSDIDGEPEGVPLIITWGSTYRTAAEAIALLRSKGRRCAHMNARWLWPAPEDQWNSVVSQASLVIVIENNPNGELAFLLRSVTGKKPDHLILKTDGRPFTVEQLIQDLQRLLP